MRTLTLLLAILWTPVVPPPQTAKTVVAGHVRLSDGSPLPGVRVAAVPVDSSTSNVLMSLGQTDSTGAYRLEGVPPGRYYLTAGLIESPVFFPGVRTPADARIVNVTDGATLADLDFILNRPAAVRVSGQLSGVPQDAPPGLLNAMLFPVEQSAARAIGGLLTTPVAGDGKFEFTNVTPGSYDLRIRSGTSLGISEEATRVLVDDRDVVNVPPPPAGMMFGRVTLEGGGSLPLFPANGAGPAGIAATSVIGIGAGKLQACCPPTVVVRADGWFAAPLRSGSDVADFQVFVSQLPFGFNVRSMVSGTTDLLRTPLNVVRGRPSALIEVTLTNVQPGRTRGGVRLSGRLTGASGALSGTIQLRGKTPTLQSALGVVDVMNIGLAPIASDGSFVFENAPPGSYEFLARVPPSTTVVRRVEIPRYDVDRVEVQLSDPEIANLQGARMPIPLGPSLPQIPIPPNPESSRSVSPDKALGSLTVSQSGTGPMYMEGSYSYFLVISSGSIVEEKRLAGSSTSFSLPAGDYELRAYVRPCDGNCGSLDPPMDECRAPFTLTPGEALIVHKTTSGHNCTLKFSPSR